MNHVKYPDIGQFREVISEINREYGYNLKPTIVFNGTVKLHGTNAAVSYCPSATHDKWRVQSRSRFITPEDDNAGFAKFITDRREQFEDILLKAMAQYWYPASDDAIITIFGEWCGKGINAGAAICHIPERSFFIFGVKITDGDKERWYSNNTLAFPQVNIFNIANYPTYQVVIDFNHPEMSTNTLAELTQMVEERCPVAAQHNVYGTGEGIVWIGRHKDKTYRFKVKGEKHSVTKVKTLAAVDTEKLASVAAFVDYAVTPARFDQGVVAVFGDPNLINVQGTGDFLRWIVNDITKEETDTMLANNLDSKDVNKAISTKARLMLFAALDGNNK